MTLRISILLLVGAWVGLSRALFASLARNPFASHFDSFMKVFRNFTSMYRRSYKSSDSYYFRMWAFNENFGRLLDPEFSIEQQTEVQELSNGERKIVVFSPNDPCGYTKSLNDFSDLTDSEFEQYYLAPRNASSDEQPGLKLNRGIDLSKFNNLGKRISKGGFSPVDEALKAKEQMSESAYSSSSLFSQQSPAIRPLKAYQRELLSIISPPSTDDITPESEAVVSPRCLSYLKRLQEGRVERPKGRKLQIGSNYLALMAKFVLSQSSMPLSLSSTRVTNDTDQSRFYQMSLLDFHTPISQPYFFIDGFRFLTSMDWRMKGVISPIKDQGKCAACYAFAAVAGLESHNALYNRRYQMLSEQEIIDCSIENRGCKDGSILKTFQYSTVNGISQQKDYPYRFLNDSATCERNEASTIFRDVYGYVSINKGVLEIIKLLQFGPVSVNSFASPYLRFYSSGIFMGEGCQGQTVPNHAALIIGYNFKVPTPYFILKNSWGLKFGESGFYNIAIGPLAAEFEGLCLLGATTDNAIPIVSRKENITIPDFTQADRDATKVKNGEKKILPTLIVNNQTNASLEASNATLLNSTTVSTSTVTEGQSASPTPTAVENHVTSDPKKSESVNSQETHSTNPLSTSSAR